MDSAALGCYTYEAIELMNMSREYSLVLTADVDGVLECLSDLRVKFDHQISLRCDLIVAHHYLLGDPLSELVPLQ